MPTGRKFQSSPKPKPTFRNIRIGLFTHFQSLSCLKKPKALVSSLEAHIFHIAQGDVCLSSLTGVNEAQQASVKNSGGKKRSRGGLLPILALLSSLPQRKVVPSSVCQVSYSLVSGSVAVCPWIEMQSDHWQHCWVQVRLNRVLSQKPSIPYAWSKSQRRGTHFIYMKHLVALDFKGASPLLQQGHLY